MRSKGKIASWNDDRGYGFIAPIDGGARIFVHIKAFGNRSPRPVLEDVVTYAVTKDKQGRPRAARASLVGAKLTRRTKRNRGAAAILVALLFLTAVGISVFTIGLPLLILIAYTTVSVTTFVAYAIDKAAAQRGRSRISERVLHLLALTGGWPGALIAQQTLRHKSKKASFRFVLWISVLLNCAAFVWLHTPDGRTSLTQLL